MRVNRMCWLGVRTDAYAPMIHLLRDVMGMRVAFEERATTELLLAAGDRVQVFGPGSRYYDFFAQEARGPVALFEVEDMRQAVIELRQANIPIVGPIDMDDKWEWIHFRAPDGNLFALASARQ